MSDRYKGAILSPTAPTVTPQSAGGIYTSSQQLQYQGQGVWPSAVNYPINNSLRFRSSASAYLNRTFSTPTNNKIWTWSGWVKRGKLADTNIVFGAGDGTSNNFGAMQFTTGDVIQYSQINSGSYVVQVNTSAVFRDPSAWYHVVLVYDSTNATSTDRIQIYVNGTRQSVAYTTGPFAQNTSSQINSALTHYISKLDYASLYFDGYLAEVNFIDGVALTPSSFGTTDAYGIWQPIPYTGAYGTNGFYLPFTDNSALTTSSNVGLGKDFSGNGNYWVTNNISITAGSTYDSMKDVPTNTNSNTANYCTLNPIIPIPRGTISQGNLNYLSGSTSSHGSVAATFTLPTTGKWYWEVTACNNSGGSGNNEVIGVANILNNPQLPAAGSEIGSGSRGDYAYRSDGNKYNNGNQGAYGATYTNGDVIGVAWDSDSGTITFYKNNVSQGTAFSSITQVAGKFAPASSNAETSNGDNYNFGQQPFSYTPPSGFYPLNTYNLPTPTILDGDQYFNATLYTGNGTGQSITNAGSMQPDFVWVKSRTQATSNYVYDSLRGAGYRLATNLTVTEALISGVTSFDSNGFTVGTETGNNNTGDSYVGWQWRASNAAGVSNTQGTITSTISANTTAGFSIVTYTGNGSSGATVGHGLSVTPSMVIIKSRSDNTNWQVKHPALNANQNLILNSTAATDTAPGSGYISAISSSTLTLLNGGSAIINVNGNGSTYVAYCFSQVAGYSAFGSYTGNGSADGAFVYCGFRPRWLMIKRTDAAGYSWVMLDSSRDTYNPDTTALFANTTDVDSTGYLTDFLSNGFKLRSTANSQNASGGTYIYAAFAENPFKIARAR